MEGLSESLGTSKRTGSNESGDRDAAQKRMRGLDDSAGITAQSEPSVLENIIPLDCLPNDDTVLIREETLDRDPMVQFTIFYNKRAAVTGSSKGNNIMQLATCSAAARPSVRTVVLNAFDERGFIFSSSTDSNKGQHLAENPYAAVVMFWPELMLQVRAEGRVELGDDVDAEMCFGQLPRNVRCLSLAFKQGTIVSDRQTYVDRIKKIWAQYPSNVPPARGLTAYRLKPDRIEFWNGTMTSLVYDRVEYVRMPDDSWRIYRLAAP